MARSNLGTVIRFEVVRTLAKPRFWAATLFIPALIGIVFALVASSSASTSTAADQQAKAHLDFEYSDASGLVNPAIAEAAGGHPQPDVEQGIAKVKAGQLDAFFAYPEDPSKQTIEITAIDVGMFDNGKYDAVARSVLKASVMRKIGDPKLAAIAAGSMETQTTTYQDGVRAGGIDSVIPPLAFPLLLFIVMVLLGQQMLAATLEEKENRVTEMILTTIEARSLIIGKIISLFIVGIVQMLVFALPVLIGYLFFRDQLNFPSIDLSQLSFAPGKMVVGAVLLVGGFALFTGIAVAIGAAMPTAKDAGPFYAVIIFSIIIPLYVVAQIIANPSAPIVTVFTFFPTTAPMTALLRNAFGSLSTGQAIIVIVETYVVAVIAIRLAIQLFRSGSIEYSRRVDVRSVLRRGTR